MFVQVDYFKLYINKWNPPHERTDYFKIYFFSFDLGSFSNLEIIYSRQL